MQLTNVRSGLCVLVVGPKFQLGSAARHTVTADARMLPFPSLPCLFFQRHRIFPVSFGLLQSPSEHLAAHSKGEKYTISSLSLATT